MAPQLIDSFHRKLHAELSKEIDQRMVDLASGSAKQITGGPSTVAENYAAQVSYIQALNDVLALSAQLERNQYGGSSEDGGDGG